MAPLNYVINIYGQLIHASIISFFVPARNDRVGYKMPYKKEIKSYAIDNHPIVVLEMRNSQHLQHILPQGILMEELFIMEGCCIADGTGGMQMEQLSAWTIKTQISASMKLKQSANDWLDQLKKKMTNSGVNYIMRGHQLLPSIKGMKIE